MWNMVDCPDESAKAESQVLASGNSFRFHSAERLVPLVHSVDDEFCVGRENRKHQLVLTVADQAMAGPSSIQFVAHEAVVDNLPCDPLKEGVCAFHTSDCVGGSTDKAFAEVVCQDRFLRLVCHHFNWGTGRLILWHSTGMVKKGPMISSKKAQHGRNGRRKLIWRAGLWRLRGCDTMPPWRKRRLTPWFVVVGPNGSRL